MTLLLLFIAAVAVGAGCESLWNRRSTTPEPSQPANRRRLLPRLALGALGVLVLATLGGLAYAQIQFNKIETVPVGSVLAGSSSGTNYLLVGTDNRPGVEGDRSDTMLVLRVAGGTSTIMSIPRDLFVTIPGKDGQHRINAAYNDGPETLIRTVQESLGIPIDRYIEINFVSFAGVVDALGGVTINFENPASDPKSGLVVEQSGPVVLNGEQSLAFVRSRSYAEVVDGEIRVDPTGDLGRVERQQAFLRAILSKAGESRSPFKMAKLGRALTGGLKIDDAMTLFDAMRFAWNMGRLNPESVVLPTTPTTTSGGAQVLLLQTDAAEPILAGFRS